MSLLRFLIVLLSVCGALVGAQTSETGEIVYNSIEELPECAQKCIGYAQVSAAFPGGCGGSPALACDCNLGAFGAVLFDCFVSGSETSGMVLEGCHSQNLIPLVTFVTNLLCRKYN
jgi:hypothetical protein